MPTNQSALAVFLILVALAKSWALKFSLEIDGQKVDVQFDPYQALTPQAVEIMNFEVGENKLVDFMSGACTEGQDAIVCVQDRIVGTMEDTIIERFTTLSSSLVTVEAMGEGLEISIARTYIALSEVKKTLYSRHFEGLSPESRSLRLATSLLEIQAFLYSQLSERSRQSAETALEKAAALASTGYVATELQKKRDMYKHIQNFDQFEEEKYGTLMQQLTSYALQEQPSNVEGGIFIDHGAGSFLKSSSDRHKRECLLMSVMDAGARNIGEIGFNAGHSSAMFLSVLEGSKVHSFDICRHSYTQPAAKALYELFEERLSLTCGDSRTTLKEFAENTSDRAPFDYFFVDGSHSYDDAYEDIVNSCALSEKGAGIAVDDCNDSEVRLAWIEAVKNGVVVEKNKGVCWVDTCFGACT
ncbi:hypothetical protein TrST_g7338 [Triparma strigata]|uniref:Methyltransferase domain-containing protein n=1 Tax=Triparma strigata TaxID=1606541 RepID=A0A9W7BFE5_9STRA|nr:hypothetical protein TrST_g7338 [Triparma strigata]